MAFGLILLSIFLCFLNFPVYGADSYFWGPSNRGDTGLLEIPTARILPENWARFGVSQAYPYRYYYGTIGLFDRLEINLRVTEILGTEKFFKKSPTWKGYGNYKDKAADFKFLLLKEGKYRPAVAIGIMDPHGTRLFAAQYLVFTKQIFPFDFTFGLGNGRFGKKPLPESGEGFKVEMFQHPIDFLKQAQFFWGLQFSPSPKWAFILEYNPILYHKQRDLGAKVHFKKEPPSKFNFGIRYRPWPNVEFDLSYQRGETWALQLSFPFEIGKPWLPIYDPPYYEPPAFKTLPWQERLKKSLYYEGFNYVKLREENGQLIITLENQRYLFPSKGLKMALETIWPYIPPSVEEVVLVFEDWGVPLFYFRGKPEDIKAWARGEIDWEGLLWLSTVSTDYFPTPEYGFPTLMGFNFGWKPQVSFFLNDPSGFWKAKVGLELWALQRLWRGGVLAGGLGIYPYSNISTVNKPLSIPIRTDIVDYLDNKFWLDYLLFNQIWRWPKTNLFFRFAVGMLEMQYGGLDFETAYPLWGGKMLVGVSGSWVKKRDASNPLAFKSQGPGLKSSYYTGFLNFRLYIPPDYSWWLDVKCGRFLAGDYGVRFSVSKFIKGVTLSVWYSMTDTSVFKDNINRGYHDKGIMVSIPLRLFIGRDSKKVFYYSLSPWTRDVAQDIGHFASLFDFLGRRIKNLLYNDLVSDSGLQ